VGKALVSRLAGLPFQVAWVDSRDGMFPDLLPTNVRALPSMDPVEQAQRALPGAAYLVMTHSHALDYDLCRTILARGDFCFAGLIGSHTKAARFAHRMAREGIPAERIGRLVCPIGIAGIDSKLPEAIGIGVAAQLLRLREARWDGAGAHERGRRAAQPAGTQPQGIPIVVHRN
jgi:xanthine dehydrogenase accessory factor